MPITVNTKTYNLDTNLSPNSIRYAGPAATFQVVDHIDLKRTAPKPTKDFAGVARSEIKATRTLMTDATGRKISGSISVDASIPVGASETDVLSLIDDVADFLLTAAGQQVITRHDITP